MLLFDFHADGCLLFQHVWRVALSWSNTSACFLESKQLCTMKSQQHSDQNDAFKGFSCLYKLEYALKKASLLS